MCTVVPLLSSPQHFSRDMPSLYSSVLSSAGLLSSLCLLFVTSESDAALLRPNIKRSRVKGAEVKMDIWSLDTFIFGHRQRYGDTHLNKYHKKHYKIQLLC